MKTKNIAILLLALGLALITYRSSTAASRNACLARIFLPPSPDVQPIVNTAGQTQVAPAWELKNLDDKAVKLSDFKGKVVLLNFWATWCPPCREETPALIALQNQYKDQGLVVVGVALDTTGATKVKAFADRMKINYPIVMGDAKTVAAYGNFQAIPTTFFIDREGNVAGQHEGGADQATFEAAVKPLLEKPKSNL